MDRKKFGRRVNAARKDRGLTGERLAEACGINATYLRQIEAGTKLPSLPVFITLCREMKVSPSYLLADELPRGRTDLDDLIYRLKDAKPGQIGMISAMIQAALDSIDDE